MRHRSINLHARSFERYSVAPKAHGERFLVTNTQGRAVALIPARGGSKSVPRKNVMSFAGKPLIAHTILAARKAALVDRVFVSTDDEEIASVSREYGAGIIERPGEFATDQASSESALLHALSVLEQRDGLPDVTVFLQCTSPMTTGVHIDELVTAIAKGADSALTVQRSHAFLWKAGPVGASGVNHDFRSRPRRQDREPEFLETGAGYAFRTDAFIRARHRFFGHIALVETPDTPPIEIDEPSDFKILEALMFAREEGL